MDTPDARSRAGLRALLRTAGLIGLVFLLGVIGYLVLGGPGYGVLDAVYMTVITLTTVGYAETIDLSDNPAGRVFTIVLLMLGVGSFVYFFSNLTAFMVEGHLSALLRSGRMKRKIDSLQDHFIVCGAGSTGQHIVRELQMTGRPFVAIDVDEAHLRTLEAKLDAEFPNVTGDATDDATLCAAGIERARGLVTCIAADKDNLIVTVSARLLNPKLRIISRCIDDQISHKIRQAGADAIVSPNTIGGLRMVSELVRPTVVSFLDVMLRDEQAGLRVEEFPIGEGSALVGATLATLRARNLRDVLILAVRDVDGAWRFNPDGEMALEAGTTLVYMGGPGGRATLESLTRA